MHLHFLAYKDISVDLTDNILPCNFHIAFQDNMVSYMDCIFQLAINTETEFVTIIYYFCLTFK